MFIEEILKQQGEEIAHLQQELAEIKRYGFTTYATITQLAEIMHCSTSTVRNKIKSGEIIATYKTGDARIPMNQFTNDVAVKEKVEEARERRAAGKRTMADMIFKGGQADGSN